jgi:hypothetical protein
VASCALLAPGLPFPEIPLVRDKIEYLARHGDEYDVLFLGSSRMHSHIMPWVFDQVAGENGVPVKSFNAGVAGMRSPEDQYVLEEILRRPHRRLRWVFVELSRLNTEVAGEDTARFGYWHDTVRLWMITRRLRGMAMERLEKNPTATFRERWEIWRQTAEQFDEHARQWVMRAVHLGRGMEALNDWLSAPTHEYTPGKSLGAKHDGWMAMDRGGRPAIEGVALASYQAGYRDRLAKPAEKERGDPVSQSALERLLSTVVQGGARPVLVVPPTTSAFNFYPTEARERELTILDFSDVQQNAALFAPERRINWDHLNSAGAELFSQILAQRFAELAKQPRGM